jgi:hypothetical protein
LLLSCSRIDSCFSFAAMEHRAASFSRTPRISNGERSFTWLFLQLFSRPFFSTPLGVLNYAIVPDPPHSFFFFFSRLHSCSLALAHFATLWFSFFRLAGFSPFLFCG